MKRCDNSKSLARYEIKNCTACNDEGKVWQTKVNGYGYEYVTCDHVTGDKTYTRRKIK